VLRLRHGARLVGDLLAYSRINRVWWLPPLLVVLAVAVLLAAAGQAAVPVSVYTLF
jgi:hypothetical protein